MRRLLPLTGLLILLSCDASTVKPDADFIDNNNDGYDDRDVEFLEMIIARSGVDAEFLEIGNQRWNDGRLDSLSISNRGLEFAIPEEIGNLEYLSYLALPFNNIYGIIPAGIGNLTRLRHLDLGGNDLEGPIPPEIGNLKAVESISFNWNNLTGEIPESIGKLTALRRLLLYGNHIYGHLPATLGNLLNLEFLHASDNDLSGPIPPEIGNLVNLDILNLNDNHIWGYLPDELGNLVRAREIDLRNNSIRGIIPNEYVELINLEILDLSFNQLTGQIPAALFEITSLRNLMLNDNQFRGIIPESICQTDINFTSQYAFNVSNNNLCPEYPPCVEGFEGIQECIEYINPCLLEPDPGSCLGYVESYYYDQDEDECRIFIWGGCDGVVPFETLEDCRQACE